MGERVGQLPRVQLGAERRGRRLVGLRDEAEVGLADPVDEGEQAAVVGAHRGAVLPAGHHPLEAGPRRDLDVELPAGGFQRDEQLELALAGGDADRLQLAAAHARDVPRRRALCHAPKHASSVRQNPEGESPYDMPMLHMPGFMPKYRLDLLIVHHFQQPIREQDVSHWPKQTHHRRIHHHAIAFPNQNAAIGQPRALAKIFQSIAANRWAATHAYARHRPTSPAPAEKPNPPSPPAPPDPPRPLR